jgi:signal transduction histidine kinase
LVELIKNAYDADATRVVVHGEHLDDARTGRIVITDDGIGMGPEEFEQGFLRIASRLKEQGERRSLRYKRRFTGAKGIGRLAAHKLAKFIEINSIPAKDFKGDDARSVDASIDWDVVESLETLDDIEASGAIRMADDLVPPKARPGTRIELTRLRRKWSPSERTRFFTEVQTFLPPKTLINFPSKAALEFLLFDRPVVSSSRSHDPGFAVELSGELETGEEYWQALVQAAQWVVEVDALKTDNKIKINIAPTRRGKLDFPAARRRIFTMEHPDPDSGPFFQARVLIREGTGGTKTERAWLGRSSGIRVYMEGFRVLPYGEPKDDWLSIDRDYTQRQKSLTFLEGLDFAGEPADEEEGLIVLRNNAYFGAVFLTIAGAPKLQLLVNREGFVPDESYENLVRLIKTSVYLSVRVRASAKQEIRTERSESRKARTSDLERPSRLALRQEIEAAVKNANELANDARKMAARGDFEAARSCIKQAAEQFAEGSNLAERLMTEGAILRVLASVGTQMAAFVHEINSLLGKAIELEGVVAEIRNDPAVPSAVRQKIARLHGAIGELRRSVERQASYLTDVISPDARRRRSRQNLKKKFDSGKALVEYAAQRKGVELVNDIPEDIKSPPMFPAEVTLIFSNLLTNAVKAAGRGGRIWAHAKVEDEDTIVLRIENTGKVVDPKNGERWFRPFESTTIEADPVLGQGMGMGLPITRNMLEEYGATILFVPPSRGYSTALQIKFEE